MRHWCEFKHLVTSRELGVENSQNTARLITQANDETNNELTTTFIKQQDAITSNIRDQEGLIHDLISLVECPDAEDVAVFDRTQFLVFLQQIGHMICIEEHFVDHMNLVLSRMERAKGEEKTRMRKYANRLLRMLDDQRDVRQNFINRMLHAHVQSKTKETK